MDLLFNAHRQIAQYGLATAKSRVTSKAQRSCLDAAFKFSAIAPDEADIGFASLASSCLPHKSPDASACPERWSGTTDNVEITLHSGRYNDGRLVGIPYGAKARIILLYLTTQAVKSSEPQVELGASMYAWLRAMNEKRLGGMTYRLFAEQAKRIAAMTLYATTHHGQHSESVSGRGIRALVSHLDQEPLGDYLEPASTSPFPHLAQLQPQFWQAARSHSLPLRLSAISLIGNNSCALDLYVWLIHRLRQLDEPAEVNWERLHGMFGSGYRHARQMKKPFLEALSLALAVYPQAQVEATDSGIVLLPSANTEAHF